MDDISPRITAEEAFQRVLLNVYSTHVPCRVLLVYKTIGGFMILARLYDEYCLCFLNDFTRSIEITLEQLELDYDTDESVKIHINEIARIVGATLIPEGDA